MRRAMTEVSSRQDEDYCESHGSSPSRRGNHHEKIIVEFAKSKVLSTCAKDLNHVQSTS